MSVFMTEDEGYHAVFTCNAVGYDGQSYAVYFQCDSLEDAEEIVDAIGIETDEAGVCAMVEVWGDGLH